MINNTDLDLECTKLVGRIKRRCLFLKIINSLIDFFFCFILVGVAVDPEGKTRERRAQGGRIHPGWDANPFQGTMRNGTNLGVILE